MKVVTQAIHGTEPLVITHLRAVDNPWISKASRHVGNQLQMTRGENLLVIGCLSKVKENHKNLNIHCKTQSLAGRKSTTFKFLYLWNKFILKLR